MRTAIISLTKRGFDQAKFIAKVFDYRVDIYAKRLTKTDYPLEVFPIEGNFTAKVHRIFSQYDNIIFICATGIAVRAIADVVDDKRKDPAIVVVDEQGKFAISLLSGHLGGANQLCTKIAQALEAIPVITTASDGQGFEGIDVLSKKLGLYIDNFSQLATISSLLINDEKVAFIGDDEVLLKTIREHIPKQNAVFEKDIPKDAKGVVFVTDKTAETKLPSIFLRPQNTILGIGSKRGVSYEILEQGLYNILEEQSLSPNSIRCIASIDIKKDEKALAFLAEKLKVPFKTYTAEELAVVEDLFPISKFVKKTVGVGSVARTAAYLASYRGKEISYNVFNGITLAIFKRRIP